MIFVPIREANITVRFFRLDLKDGPVRELHNFIHGQQAKAAGGKTAPLVDPSTGEAFAEAPVSSPEDVERALLSSKDAFGAWKRSYAFRAQPRP